MKIFKKIAAWFNERRLDIICHLQLIAYVCDIIWNWLWSGIKSWKVDIIALPLMCFLLWQTVVWVETAYPTIGSINPLKLQRLVFAQLGVMVSFTSAWLGIKLMLPPVYNFFCGAFKDYFSNGVASPQKVAIALGILFFMVWVFVYLAVNF